MKVIVDTNIVFSAILNTQGSIGDLLFNSTGQFDFYSCRYMRFEIDKHWSKLKQISKLSDAELIESKFHLFGKLTFINEELIPTKTWKAAEVIAQGIDVDNVDFIALTKHLKGRLWTGDKALYHGLKAIHFRNVHNTAELLAMRSQLG